jgi:ABC-type lipoprotein release transport system permease subunit
VNETFARYFFGQTNPLGRRFSIAGGSKFFEIIGIVKNSKQVDLRQADRRFAYLAWRQSEDLGGLTFYLKTTMDATGIAPALRREIEKVAPGVAMGEIRTLEQVVEASLAGERVVAYLCLLFAGLATLLSAVGLYGVMAYSVERRTREIGLRVALGAARGSVIGMVLSEAMKMALGGALLGLPLFYGLSRLVRAQLYGLAPHDPATVVWAVIVILAAVALAAFGPAYRASRTDPMTALRYE